LVPESRGYGVFDHAGAHHIIMAGGATSLVLSFAMGKLGEKVVGNKDYTNTMWLTFGLLGYLVMGDPLSQSGGAGPTLVNCFMSISGAILTNCAINIIHNEGKYDFKGEPNVDGIIEALQYGLVAMTAGASVISPMWAVFFGFFTVLFAAAWNFFVFKVHLHGLGQFSVFFRLLCGRRLLLCPHWPLCQCPLLQGDPRPGPDQRQLLRQPRAAGPPDRRNLRGAPADYRVLCRHLRLHPARLQGLWQQDPHSGPEQD